MSQTPVRAPGAGNDPSGVRGAIDAMVSGALVELFDAYGVALAPLPRVTAARAPVLPDLSATIAFSRPGAAPGRLALSAPTAVVDLSRGPSGAALREDWIRELTNQLMGRIKNRLLHFSVRVTVGALSLVDGKQLALQLERTPQARIYSGRTLRGEVVVSLDGMPDEAELTYVGPGAQPAEGDMLFF
jgi:hypothetical protein